MAKAPDFGRMPLDESHHAVIAMTSEGEVLYWSRGAEILFGYSSGEATGRAIEQLVIPSHRIDAEREMLRDALAAGFATYESSRRTKDGQPIYVDVTKWAVRDTDGTLKFVVSIERDAAVRRA